MRLTASKTESQYAEAFTIACNLAATKVIDQVDAEREKYGFYPPTLEAAEKEIRFLKSCVIAREQGIIKVDEPGGKEYSFWPLTLGAAAKEIQSLKKRLSINDGTGVMTRTGGSPTRQTCLRIVQ